jgi:peptidoglycan/xylan/chitin deacetylase (PgdA/CDA1 family)
MRRRCIFIVAAFFVVAVLVVAWLGSPGAGAPVLTYHHIGDGPEWYNVSAADFEHQLVYLRESGYVAVSVVQLADGLEGRTQLPPRPIVITFDDGYEDNFLAAFPILERQGMRGTFFVVTGKMGNADYMSWNQAREMNARGMELGSHTVNHYTLNEINLRELERELLTSRVMLENNLPASAPIFANPFGETAPAVVELLERTGYRAACSSVVGVNRPGENPYMIRRMSVTRPQYGLWDFRVRLWLLNVAGKWENKW